LLLSAGLLANRYVLAKVQKMPLPLLSADDQRDLRDAASDAIKSSFGLVFLAKRRFERDPRVTRIAGFDPATIFLFIQIAVQLWQWWRERKISDPSVVAMGGEPTFGDVE
jgi:hypothetical protein